MRKYYQIYRDGFYIEVDKILTILSHLKMNISIEAQQFNKDSHQYILRFLMPGNKSLQELKISNNFIQVSCNDIKTSELIYNVIEKIIPEDDEEINIDIPF